MQTRLIAIFCLLLFFKFSYSCECPSLPRINAELNKNYTLIFEGVVDSVVSEYVYFSVDSIYLGNCFNKLKAKLNGANECKIIIASGEKWIVYANQTSVSETEINYCSRTRKFFDTLSDDYFIALNGCSYDEEKKMLSAVYSLRAPSLLNNTDSDKKYDRKLIQPGVATKIILVGISILTIALIYFFISKKM